MRKMLTVLSLVLTAAAAASTASAAPPAQCSRGYLVVCSSTVSFCCPNGAACLCPVGHES